MNSRPPALGTFSIFDACRDGFVAVRDNWRYLLGQARAPFGICMLNIIAVGVGFTSDPSPLETFLAMLPTTLATAYVIFIVARLCMLDERAGQLPQDRALRRDRLALLQATAIICLLFELGIGLCTSLFTWLMGPDLSAQDPGAQAASLAVAGVMFWALRFAPLPALAAIGYPLRHYALSANGVWLSFLFLGVLVLCMELPRLLLLGMVVSITGPDNLIPLVLSQALTFALTFWLFASYSAALRQMMKGRQ